MVGRDERFGDSLNRAAGIQGTGATPGSVHDSAHDRSTFVSILVNSGLPLSFQSHCCDGDLLASGSCGRAGPYRLLVGRLLLALFATSFAAFHVGLFEHADQSVFRGFANLSLQPSVSALASFVARPAIRSP